MIPMHLKNMKRVKIISQTGFPLVELMIVVAIIGLLSAIAVPNFVKVRLTAQANTCIGNLRQIDSAIQQYALEHNSAAIQTAATIQPYLGHGANGSVNGIYCPVDPTRTFETSYVIMDNSSVPACKIVPEAHILN